MLLAIVLTLRPAATYTLPANLGRATHGWFLGEIQRLNAALAASQHPPPANEKISTPFNLAARHAQRSFTVSNLLGAHTEYDESTRNVSPSDRFLLRITSLDAELSQLLTLNWLTKLPECFSFGANAKFRIEGATVDGERHRFAGKADPVALHTRCFDAPPPRFLEFEFISPTTFKSGENYLPLPLPRLVFEGLARRWDENYGALFPERVEFDVNAAEQIALSGCVLRTSNVHFNRVGEEYGFPGFTGRARFSLAQCSPPVARLAAMLAEFAVFAGVGKHTTMGLGQTQLRQNSQGTEVDSSNIERLGNCKKGGVARSQEVEAGK